MPGRVFITGASGFVGTAVVEELVSRGYGVNALARGGKLKIASAQINIVRGDLFDRKSLEAGMAGCEAVIHLVGIIAEQAGKGINFERIHVEGTRSVVDATVAAGIKRYVQMSALGTRPNAQSRYHQTKFRGEEIVRQSPLDWTILRPSLIHGPGGEFTKMEVAWARGKAAPFLFMPYFGAGIFGTEGAGLLQPVYVKDVARAFVDCIEKPPTIRRTYDLCGVDRMTWPQLHQAFAATVVGKRRWVIPIPAWYAKSLIYFLPKGSLPFNHDQVIMSQEDSVGNISAFEKDFGWKPGEFNSALKSYAGNL